jgi:pentatricopeptide repeat protein
MLGANSTSILAYLDTPHSSPGQPHRAFGAPSKAASFGGLGFGGSKTKPCGADAGASPDKVKPCSALYRPQVPSTADSEEGHSRFFACAPGATHALGLSEPAPLTVRPGSLSSMEFDANSMFAAFKHASFESSSGAALTGRSAMDSPLSSSSLSSSASLYGLHMDSAAANYQIGSESSPSVMGLPAGGGKAMRYDFSLAPPGSATLPFQFARGTHEHEYGSPTDGLLAYAQQHDSRGSLRVTAAPFNPSSASSPPLGLPAPEYVPPISFDSRPISMSVSQPGAHAAIPPGSEWGYSNLANSDLISGACRGSKFPSTHGSTFKSSLPQSTMGSACAGAMPLPLGGIMGGAAAGGFGIDGAPRSADAYGGAPQRFGSASTFTPAFAPPQHLPASTDRRSQPPVSPQHGARGTPPPSLPGAMGGPWNTAGTNPQTPLPSAGFSPLRPQALGGSGAGMPAMDQQAMASFNNMCSAVGLNQMQMLNLQHLVMQLTHATTNKQELRKMLQGYLSQERVAEAHVLVGMMRLVGLPVDVVMYNLLMTAYKKRRQWQLVMQVMQQMQSSNVVPDTVSYNILIDACGKSQVWAKDRKRGAGTRHKELFTACALMDWGCERCALLV